jgi:hypothetical protein
MMTKSITSINSVAAEGSGSDGINRQENGISMVPVNTVSIKSNGTSIMDKETIGMARHNHDDMTNSITRVNNVAAEGSVTDGINRRERGISMTFNPMVSAYTVSNTSSGTSIIGKETVGMVRHQHDDMTVHIASVNNVAAEVIDTDGINRRERGISMVPAITLSHKSSGTSIIGKETVGMVRKRFVSMLIISTLNLIVVGTLNFTYVLVILSYNGTVVTLVDIGMGVFKAVWTNVVIVEAMRLLDAHYIKSNKRELSFLSFTSILNNIVIPCMALTLASPDCFYNMIYSRDDVVSSYSLNTWVYLDADNNFIYAAISAVNVTINYETEMTFTPPYAYSYQCSSAILTSYVVIFLYSALFGLLSQPLADRVKDDLTVAQDKLVTQSFLSSKGSGSAKVTSTIPDEMPVPPSEIDAKSSSLSHNNIMR